MLHGLYWLTSNLATLGPLTLVVDDAHWADTASLRFLVHLVRRIADLPAALVVAVRGEPADGVLAELCASPGRVVVRPEPLTGAAVATLVEAGLGAVPDPAFTRACRHATGGTPFLVRELIAALRADGVAPVAAAAGHVETLGPDTVARATLARLDADATALAQAVAALGAEAQLHRAAELAGLGEGPAADAYDRLVAAGVLRHQRPIEFVHPILRAAVYGALPPARRSALHARAARLLTAQGAEADAISAQLLATDPSGRPDVVAFLRDAAAAAQDRGAVDSAIVYLRRALEEGAGSRAELLHELGIAARLLRWPAALDYLREAYDLTGDADIGLDLAMTLIYANRWDDALALIRPALDGTTGPTAARAHTYWAAAAAFDPRMAGEFERRLPALRAMVARGGPEVRSLALLLASRLAAMNIDIDTVPALVAQGLDGGNLLAEESAEAWAIVQGAWALNIIGDLERADRLALDVLGDGYERASPLSVTIGTLIRAWVGCERGELVSAEGLVRTALDTTLEYGMVFGVPSLLFYAQEVLVERPTCGDIAALALDTELPPDIAATITGAFVAQVAGRVRLAQGDVEGAIADLRRCGEIRAGLSLVNPAECAWRSHLALALATVDPEEARAVARAEIAAAEAAGSVRAAGVARRTLGRVDEAHALEHLHAAVAAHENDPDARLELARDLVDLGSALRRAGRRTDAREPLRRGLDLAERCGAARLVEHARAELGATGARPRRARLTGAEALTASERRIAGLAAAGQSNPEIAQALFISRNTVQTHLRHVYAKLGIGSREELGPALAAPHANER